MEQSLYAVRAPSALDHRRGLLAQTSKALDTYFRFEREQNQANAATVWSFGALLGQPQSSLAPAGTHLRVTWPLGLSASLSVRLGDVRIGIIVPSRLIKETSLLSGFYPYAEIPMQPARLMRQLGDDETLVDFIFTARLGDFDLTRLALSGDTQSMDLLSDALAMETAHLIAALGQYLADSGMFLGQGEMAHLSPLYVTTANTRIAEALNVPRAQVIRLGEGEIPGSHRYLVMTPEDRQDDLQRAIHALQHGEFMDRHSAPGMFQIDGLNLQVSGGVYHPGAGSSSVFFLEGLKEEGLSMTGPRRLLDVGCGSGVIALAAKRARPDWEVFATDIDESAVQDTRLNAEINGLSVYATQADLLELPADPPWDGLWDLIAWNYPFWQIRPQGSPSLPFDRIGLDENGTLLKRFIGQLPDKLAPGGACYITYSTMADAGLLTAQCARHGLRAQCAIEASEPGGYSRQIWKISATC